MHAVKCILVLCELECMLVLHSTGIHVVALIDLSLSMHMLYEGACMRSQGCELAIACLQHASKGLIRSYFSSPNSPVETMR